MKMEDTKTRVTRDLTKRDTAERLKKWMPPQLLPDPLPEPGFSFRWIRTSTLNVDDPMNVSSKMREGWEPVKATDHPEIQMMSAPNSRFKDGIEVGGLLLCKTPTEFTEQRDEYYRGQAEAQMRSVDTNFMRDNDPRMPLFSERKSEVKFGRGT
jgi:hypothetical protein